MKQTLLSVLALLRTRLSNLLMYRLSFFTTLFVDGTLFVLQLAFFQLLATGSAAQGWNAAMYTMFIGSFLTLDGAYMSTWFFGVISLPDMIRTGELDLYLVRPLHTLTYVSFGKMDGGSMPLVILGIIMSMVGAWQMGSLTIANVLLWFMAVTLMYVLMYALSLIVRTVAFWTTSTQALSEFENSMVTYSFRLPLPAITGAWKLILLLALPYGLAANFPAYVLAGSAPPLWWLYALAVTAVFLLISLRLWRAGLRRYESASS